MQIVIDIPEDLYNNIRKGGFWLESGLTLSDAYDFIKYGTPVPNKGEWIPVSERMPNNHEYIKNNGLFNVSDGNRVYSEWFDIYETEMFGEPTISGFRVDNAVIAWQPLPESYKEAENELCKEDETKRLK